MAKIRIVIADDEPWARDRILQMLERHPDIELAGMAADGEEALQLASRADLMFLDVSMPVLDGLAVVERLPRARRPLVIFVTASREHAARALQAHAVDYLLKPFDTTRFDSALQKARSSLQQ